VAVTERSDLISTTAVPVAVVVTGGTSFSPFKSTRWPPTIGAIVAQLAIRPAAPISNSAESPPVLLAILFIVVLLGKSWIPSEKRCRVSHN